MLGQREVLMNSFYEHHKDSIRWHYRCFDRILLNGLIQPLVEPYLAGPFCQCGRTTTDPHETQETRGSPSNRLAAQLEKVACGQQTSRTPQLPGKFPIHHFTDGTTGGL
jgi:hypothetical protein